MLYSTAVLWSRNHLLFSNFHDSQTVMILVSLAGQIVYSTAVSDVNDKLMDFWCFLLSSAISMILLKKLCQFSATGAKNSVFCIVFGIFSSYSCEIQPISAPHKVCKTGTFRRCYVNTVCWVDINQYSNNSKVCIRVRLLCIRLFQNLSRKAFSTLIFKK